MAFYVGQYQTAFAQTDCPSDLLISTKDDCEKAARYVGYEFLKDRSIPTPGDLPSKCIWDTSGVAYFNQAYAKTGPNSAIKSTMIGGICKVKGRN